jgi:hypothetical protein
LTLRKLDHHDPPQGDVDGQYVGKSFKWIKQHLHIKSYFATGENAVKTQIWHAVSIYILIAIVKRGLQLQLTLFTCLQILSVSLFEKTPILCALQPDHS